MGELVGAIVEAFAALIAGLIEITVHILAGIFSAGFLATRARGLERACHIVTLLLAAYLGFGILRAFFVPLAGPITGMLYSPVAVIAAFLLLFMSIIIPFALRQAAGDRSAARTTVLSYILAITLVFGGLAFWTETARVPAMETRHCTSLLEDLPARWQERLQDLTTRLPEMPAGISLRLERCRRAEPES